MRIFFLIMILLNPPTLWIEGTPCITQCVMAELEKLGQKYRVPLRYLPMLFTYSAIFPNKVLYVCHLRSPKKIYDCHSHFFICVSMKRINICWMHVLMCMWE